MQLQDQWGLEMTAPSVEAAESYRQLIDGYYTFAADLPARLAAAVAEPSVPLAHIALGYFLILAHTTPDHRRATEAAAHAATLELNERERQHLDALQSWLAGDYDATADSWDGLLDRWPTDAFALRLQHFVLFNRGRLEDMLASVDRATDAWGDLPRRSYLEGMRGFTLEELGRYDEAERVGRWASEADPTDLWSVHSVAHVLEMQARTDDGLAWFAGRDDVLHDGGAFARHLWWHHAIIHLRTGDYEQLLQLWDDEVQPGEVTDGLSLTNAIDGLARLEFAGVDVGDRWLPLLEPVTMRLGYHGHPFNDVHFAYAISRAGADDLARQLLDGMADWRDRPTTAGAVIDEVGLDTATAMAALGAGRTEEAARLLEPGRDLRWKLGGSHAQRKVFDLAEAFARG